MTKEEIKEQLSSMPNVCGFGIDGDKINIFTVVEFSEEEKQNVTSNFKSPIEFKVLGDLRGQPFRYKDGN